LLQVLVLRIGFFLPVLAVAGALAASIHEDAGPALRIVVLESLASATANAVVPAFQTALTGHLQGDRRMASIEHIHIAVADLEPPLLRDALRGADLVVSFGALAAETARAALAGSTTPHLFAFVPRGLALALTTPAGSVQPAITGIDGQLPRGAALALADRLLASRSGAPLRIGLLHQAIGGSTAATTSLLAVAVTAPGFVPIPFELEPGPEAAAMLSGVVAAAVDAVAGEPRVDAFWLALETTAPLDLLVQAIEVQTGRPVIYAPSEAAVAAGALMSLAPDPRSTGREAAALAKRLLDGAPVADIPLRAPHRVDFALNLETADALGIVPPHELLELARGRLFR
jgi:hypothetical protein